jgi:hypothetical protein
MTTLLTEAVLPTPANPHPRYRLDAGPMDIAELNRLLRGGARAAQERSPTGA